MKKLYKILLVSIIGIFVAGAVTAAISTYWKTISDLIPRTDNQVDIGSDTKRVKKIWVYNLDASSTITAADPTLSTHLATKEYVDITLGGVYFNYFLSDTAEGVIADYNLLYPEETGEASSTASSTIDTDPKLIQTYITETTEPTFTILLPGTYAFYTHADVNSTTGYKDATIYFTLTSTDSAGGSEALLMTSENSDTLTTSQSSVILHANLATQTVLGSDDRLALKIYGDTSGSGSDPTVTIYMEGDEDCRLGILTTMTALDDRFVLNDGESTDITNGAFNLTTSGNLTTTGTITGESITISSPTPILVLKDSTYAGDTSLGYIEWRDKDNTRLGFFGNSSSGNDDLYWKNESSGGHINIETTGAGKVQIFANVGIGTTSPSSTLHVIGDLTVSATSTATSLIVDSNTVNLSDTTDEYVLAFDTTTQTWRGISAAGGGDVLSIGDCATGACFDGSSDGGTYLEFYNIDSNKTQLIASDTASDLVITLPATTGTLALTSVATLSSLTSIGTIGTGVWEGTAIAAGYYAAGSIDGDDMNANFAGRSLTEAAGSPDVLNADPELYTDSKSMALETPTAADDALIQLKFSTAATITEISCSVATSTASTTIQFDERVEATPNTAGTDIMSAALVCDHDTASTTSFANAGIAANALMSLDVDAVTGTPGILRIHVFYTKDD